MIKNETSPGVHVSHIDAGQLVPDSEKLLVSYASSQMTANRILFLTFLTIQLACNLDAILVELGEFPSNVKTLILKTFLPRNWLNVLANELF